MGDLLDQAGGGRRSEHRGRESRVARRAASGIVQARIVPRRPPRPVWEHAPPELGLLGSQALIFAVPQAGERRVLDLERRGRADERDRFGRIAELRDQQLEDAVRRGQTRRRERDDNGRFAACGHDARSRLYHKVSVRLAHLDAPLELGAIGRV